MLSVDYPLMMSGSASWSDLSQRFSRRWGSRLHRLFSFHAIVQTSVKKSHLMMFGNPAWQPGEMHLTVGPGSKVWLDADKTSGPDGDEVPYRWYPYREAGSFPLTIHYRNLSREFPNPATSASFFPHLRRISLTSAGGQKAF